MFNNRHTLFASFLETGRLSIFREALPEAWGRSNVSLEFRRLPRSPFLAADLRVAAFVFAILLIFSLTGRSSEHSGGVIEIQPREIRLTSSDASQQVSVTILNED